MKRLPLLILLLLISPSLAQEVHFKDMPDRHWAEKSVYYLVKLGVTNGYPDGTFQGLKKMDRYMITTFISNLSSKLEDTSQVAKLLAELKNEFAVVKFEQENPEEMVLNSEVMERSRVGNLFTNYGGAQGPRLDYRLKLTGKKFLGSTKRYVKINLDTMDAGYNGYDRDLVSKMFDIEARGKFGIWDLKGTAGPGTVSHQETDGCIPSDDYYIYMRPKGTLGASTSLGKMDFSLSYVTRKVTLSGYVGLSEYVANLAYNYDRLPILGKTKVTAIPRYLSWDGGHDVRAELQLDAAPSDILSGQILFGAGHLQSHRAYYAKAVAALSRPNTSLAIKLNKVGSDYRSPIDKYEFVNLNSFNKLILDGSVDAALEFTQKMSETIKLKVTSDVALAPDLRYGKDVPGTSLTNQIDLGNDTFGIFYRNYFVPSGLSSADPTMVKNVATSSDLVGITFTQKI